MTPATPVLRSKLLRRAPDPERLAREVVGQPRLLAELIEGLDAREPPIKFGSAKVLRCLSRIKPALLYPEVDVFLAQLQSDHTFLKCDALLILAHLATVDAERKVEKNLDRYFAGLADSAPILARTILKGGVIMARGRPRWTDAVVDQLLSLRGSDDRTSPGPMFGQVVDVLGQIFEWASDENQQRILEWVRGELDGGQAATREKAAKFLEERGPTTQEA